MKTARPTYELIVNGYGSIYCGPDHLIAITEFLIFRNRSIKGEGRAGHRSVILMENDQPIRQHLVCCVCAVNLPQGGAVENAVACCGQHYCLDHLKQHDADCDAEYGHTEYRQLVPPSKTGKVVVTV